jgi:MoaA/NifB/PqqE/SkfB family radical SAM enzyme
VHTNGSLDLLDPGLMHEVRLELTTRCNLRCVYCAVSQSTYEGSDMPEALAYRVIPLIADLASSKLGVVHVNGHGETTFLSGWMEVCESLLQLGLPISITTNLARDYSEAETDILAQMRIIHISLDSSDRDLMKTIRRRVDINRIVANMSGIRAAAQGLKKPEPEFHFSCGIYDRNAALMEEFARFSVELGIKGVGFWNLTSWKYDEFPYENTDVSVADRVYPLDTLSNVELRSRMEAILRGIDIMKQGGIKVHANGNFIEVLNRRLQNVPDAPVTVRSHIVPGGMTRDCVDPWTYFEMGTKGDIKPCCAHSKIGNLGEQSLSEILNGEGVRD